jgi:hypothetical protein
MPVIIIRVRLTPCLRRHIQHEMRPVCFAWVRSIVLRAADRRRRMSLHLVIGNMSWSRRRVLSAVAGAATTLTSFAALSRAAQAEAAAAAWREYRNDEMGFRVEMPGEFKTDQEVGEAKDPWVKAIGAEIEFDGMTMGVHGTEFRGAPKAEELYKLQREGMQASGMQATREEQRTVSGVAAREFIREADDFNYIHRMVLVGNRTVAVGVFGERNIHGNATARRFLDSLTLLRGGR